MKINNPKPIYGYLIDNSYSICLTDSNILVPDLVGSWNEKAKRVRIISEPYKGMGTGYGEGRVYEFITVLFEGNKYRVLNNIRDKE